MDTWNSVGHLPLLEKFYLCSTKLQSWGRQLAGQFKNRITYHKNMIECHRQKKTTGGAQETNAHKKALSKILFKEEIF